jgi:DNA (cytosine-5)-methyltransferase 1
MARTFYEFFAGGGMARAGLGPRWDCLFANDFSPMKASAYEANWGRDHLFCGDVAQLKAGDLPGAADLAWASFPCQDLSLAGEGLGLGRPDSAMATRSGTFWSFWALIKRLKTEGRAPRLIVLENVYGALTSREGADFAAIGAAFSTTGYRFGAVLVDAVRFVPQSRPRVFFIAVEAGSSIPKDLCAAGPSEDWHPRALVEAQARLSRAAKKSWLWWNFSPPPARNVGFADLIEDQPTGVRWHTKADTERLLSLMTPLNLAKVEAARRLKRRTVGGVYRRTRPDENGAPRQRAEVRFDDVAGCLRTPAGGSSRQTILVVDGNSVRSRLLSPREAARLMGLPDDYLLPSRYNDAYHVVGDGVCVPVVRHLAGRLLEPILATSDLVGGMRAAE